MRFYSIFGFWSAFQFKFFKTLFSKNSIKSRFCALLIKGLRYTILCVGERADRVAYYRARHSNWAPLPTRYNSGCNLGAALCKEKNMLGNNNRWHKFINSIAVFTSLWIVNAFSSFVRNNWKIVAPKGSGGDYVPQNRKACTLQVSAKHGIVCSIWFIDEHSMVKVVPVVISSLLKLLKRMLKPAMKSILENRKNHCDKIDMSYLGQNINTHETILTNSKYLPSERAMINLVCNATWLIRFVFFIISAGYRSTIFCHTVGRSTKVHFVCIRPCLSPLLYFSILCFRACTAYVDKWRGGGCS